MLAHPAQGDGGDGRADARCGRVHRLGRGGEFHATRLAEPRRPSLDRASRLPGDSRHGCAGRRSRHGRGPARAEVLGDPVGARRVAPDRPGPRDRTGGDPCRERPPCRANRPAPWCPTSSGSRSCGPTGARLTAGARDVDAPALDRDLPYAGDQHEVFRCLEVVGLVGAVPAVVAPQLAVTAADAAAADAVLTPDPRPLVAINPGATDPRRRWPAECFTAVAGELTRRGARVVLVGAGPDDRGAAAAIRATVSTPPEELVDRVTLGALAGVLARCRVVVGNDSGPRHLAEAVGAATVGVYLERNLRGAGPLARWRHRVAVSAPTTCPVCGADERRERCGHDASLVAEVPVDDVLAAAVELLGDAGDRPGQQIGRRAFR
ncbi:glycosyltransferase family 9 protein [Geodermatophilus sp. TF02-6]|uniref:glycosyltransferase family 9 protein n=1 Tax=Geodermatophilus sp. TF02-6 TaxID=2250575 RepID=UPI000DE80818|nr:glycosyltransferase family 9 protein [Geodermatophilus sp. TF02-6]RBY76128.1 glycosyltransferase family 9 protein [Geodermatophilus sp. TF02-6]